MAYNRHRSRIAASLTQSLGEFQKQEHYTDVTISVGSKTYNCHKLVLAAASPFFDKMFSSDFREKNEGIVTLKEVSCEIFENVLSYLYNENDPVNSTNVEDMLKAVCMLQIPSIQERCEKFLISHLCVNNCLSTWKLASTFSCETLSNKTFRYILKKFGLISKTNSFLELKKEDVIKIIADNRVGVADENDVAMAVTKWFKFDRDSRHAALEDMLQHVRFPLMTIAQIYRIQKTEIPVIENSFLCIRILDEAKQYQSFPWARHTFASARCTYRTAMEKVMVFPVNINQSPVVTSVLLFDTTNSRWWKSDINCELCRFSGFIAVNNELWLAGQKKLSYRLQQEPFVYKTNLAIPKGSKVDTAIPCLLTDAFGTEIISSTVDRAVCALDESLYIVTWNEENENVFRFNLKDRNTTNVVSLQKNASSAESNSFTTMPLKVQALATVNENLYIFGHQVQTQIANIQRLSTQEKKASLLEFGKIPENPTRFQSITQDDAIILICSGGNVLKLTEANTQELHVEHILKVKNLEDSFSSGLYQGCLYIATPDQKLRKFDLKSGLLLVTISIPCADLSLGLWGIFPAPKERKTKTAETPVSETSLTGSLHKTEVCAFGGFTFGTASGTSGFSFGTPVASKRF